MSETRAAQELLMLTDHLGRQWAMCEADYLLGVMRERDHFLDILKAFIRAYDGQTVDIGTRIASTIPAARKAIAKAEGK